VKAFTEEERERFLTPEELPRLFDAIDAAEDKRIADYLRLALLTGARKTALLRMRFADADLTRAVWTIPPNDSKNGKPIHVPLVAEALEVLRSRLFAAGGGEYVFPWSAWDRAFDRPDETAGEGVRRCRIHGRSAPRSAEDVRVVASGERVVRTADRQEPRTPPLSLHTGLRSADIGSRAGIGRAGYLGDDGGCEG
jgi:integrase